MEKLYCEHEMERYIILVSATFAELYHQHIYMAALALSLCPCDFHLVTGNEMSAVATFSLVSFCSAHDSCKGVIGNHWLRTYGL